MLPYQDGLLPASTESPCVRLCTLDDQDVCIGCGRTLEQITQWRTYNPGQRQAIMNQLRPCPKPQQ